MLDKPKKKKTLSENKNMLFFLCGPSLNAGPCVYYALFITTKLSSRGQTFHALVLLTSASVV